MSRGQAIPLIAHEPMAIIAQIDTREPFLAWPAMLTDTMSTDLDVLQCKILCLGPSVYFEARSLASDEREKRLDRGDDSVHIHINMIAPNCRCEVFCTFSGICA
jgi:hypothetical protein